VGLDAPALEAAAAEVIKYNELNQLTEDDSCIYNYDADGNMTAKIDKKTGDSTIFTWFKFLSKSLTDDNKESIYK
jgi:hypothetical protein